MEKQCLSIDAKIKDGNIYEAHQFALSMARRVRKKDPHAAIDLLTHAVKSLSVFEDTLEVAKYPLLMAKEDPELTSKVVEFCVQATLNWANQAEWLLEWDKVCIQFNNQQGNSHQIPTAFALKYLDLGLLDQALGHLDNAPISILVKAVELIDQQKIPSYKKHQYLPLVPLLLHLLSKNRTGAVLELTTLILERDLYPKESEIFQIIYTMGRAAQSELDKRTWVKLRMFLEQRIDGATCKKELDLAAHLLFQMPLQKQMTMSDMMKSMMGGG